MCSCLWLCSFWLRGSLVLLSLPVGRATYFSLPAGSQPFSPPALPSLLCLQEEIKEQDEESGVTMPMTVVGVCLLVCLQQCVRLSLAKLPESRSFRVSFFPSGSPLKPGSSMAKYRHSLSNLSVRQDAGDSLSAVSSVIAAPWRWLGFSFVFICFIFICLCQPAGELVRGALSSLVFCYNELIQATGVAWAALSSLLTAALETFLHIAHQRACGWQ